MGKWSFQQELKREEKELYSVPFPLASIPVEARGKGTEYSSKRESLQVCL